MQTLRRRACQRPWSTSLCPQCWTCWQVLAMLLLAELLHQACTNSAARADLQQCWSRVVSSVHFVRLTEMPSITSKGTAIAARH